MKGRNLQVRASRMVLALCLLLATLVAPKAQAHPWMIRHEFAECGSCHVDPMGGETLSHMGRVMGEELLSMSWGQNAPTAASMYLFGIPEPENVYLGGSLRGLGVFALETGNKRVFPMQADLTGAVTAGAFTFAASLGASRASRRYEHSSKARVLGNVEDEQFLLVSRYHWVGYRLNRDWMVRAGRINLPFGIRMTEHTLYVRSETLTDRESDQQHGLSVVYTAGRVRAELLGSLGNFQIPNDGIRERGYSGYLEYLVEPNLALGLSSLVLVARRDLEVDQGAVSRQAHGFTARFVPAKPLVLLAEANALKKTGSSLGYVGMASLDLEPVQGLHFGLTGEALDRGKGPAGAELGRGKPQVGGWLTLNWFFAPHFDVRVDLVKRQRREELLLTQLHFYL
jgi:hypothetical protein